MSLSSEEQTIFNPKAPQSSHFNSEWVSLTDGRVCVRELCAADKLFVIERAQRPAAPGAAPTVDAGSIMLWQIVVSCYDGAAEEAQRIFDMTDLPVIRKLRGTDWDRLVGAIERVNSLADAEVSAIEGFTKVPAGDSVAT